MTNFKIAAAGALLLLMGACQMSQEIDVQAEKALVEQAINDCIMWPYPEKNPERLRGCLVKDSTFFIFHPDSRSTIDGYAAFEDMIQTVFLSDKLKATGSEISDLKIHLSRSGDVAWYSCILQDHGEWDGNPYDWVNCRWTGVLEKHEGKWLIVQMHFSFPSDASADEG